MIPARFEGKAPATNSSSSSSVAVGSGGMSRAAKKRAKMKDKKSITTIDTLDQSFHTNNTQQQKRLQLNKRKQAISSTSSCNIPLVSLSKTTKTSESTPTSVVALNNKKLDTTTTTKMKKFKSGERGMTMLHSDDIIVDNYDDDCNQDDLDAEDDGSTDELVAMKDSSTVQVAVDATTAKSTSSFVSILPKNIKSLVEILDNDHYDDDDEDEKEENNEHHDNHDADAYEDEDADEDGRTKTRMNAQDRAKCILEFILQPSSVDVSTFYDKYWEKLPLHIRGEEGGLSYNTNENNTCTGRYDGFISIENIKDWMYHKKLYYVRDVSIIKHKKGKDGNIRTNHMEPIHTNKKKPTKLKLAIDSNGDDNGLIESSITTVDLDEQFVRVDPSIVWDQLFIKDGCTIQLLCPVQYSPTIHSLLSLLELEFGCRVGANATLKPSTQTQTQTQTPPRYDAIEAFHIQIEGYQQWKVYKPKSKAEQLPRMSSGDLQFDIIDGKELVLDIILEPGDVLYIPRGYIYQCFPYTNSNNNSSNSSNEKVGSTLLSSSSSLHMTISAMQQWAWIDLMELVLPEAMSAAAASTKSTSLREGLPRQFLEYMGAIHDNYRTELLPEPLRQKQQSSSIKTINDGTNVAVATTTSTEGEYEDDDETPSQIESSIMKQLQEDFRKEAKRRIMRIANEAMDILDAACDQMGIRFLSDRLPPSLTESERQNTNSTNDTNDINVRIKIQPNMLCRIVRRGIARLVIEADTQKAVVYHCNENSLVFHENPLSPMEFELDDAPAIEQLLTTYEPHWICITDLYHDTIEDKIGVAQALYDEGILAVRIFNV